MGNPKVTINSGDDEKSIIVICPTCRRTRTVKMYWSGGNVIPRIRCSQCKTTVSKRGSSISICTEVKQR